MYTTYTEWSQAVNAAGYTIESWGIAGSSSAHNPYTGKQLGEWVAEYDCNNGTRQHGYFNPQNDPDPVKVVV